MYIDTSYEKNPAPAAEEVSQPARPLPVLQAFTTGVQRAAVYWPVLIWMLLGTLLASGLLALITALNLLNFAHNPAIAELASGVKAWQIVDVMGVMNTVDLPPESGDVRSAVSIVMLAFVFMPLVGGIISAFLYGGSLLTYREAPARFRLGRFLWGCWHWFGAYLVIGLLQAVLFLLIMVPLGYAAFSLSLLGPAATVLSIAIIVLALVFWLMIFELARVQLVVAGTRNPFKGIGSAFRTISRNLPRLIGFYGLTLLALLAVQVVFRLGINPYVPLNALVLALLVQQGFLLARLITRAIRLAGLAAMQ